MTIRRSTSAAAMFFVAGALVLLWLGTGAPATTSAATSTEPMRVASRAPGAGRVEDVAAAAPVERASDASRPAPLATGLPERLDVELDGARVSWALEQIREVPRRGGTHDLRELTSALFGRTDLTVRVAGETADGEPRTATVDLGTLDRHAQLRVWPELDGTWTVARNTNDDGAATLEVYRLTGVRTLGFVSDSSATHVR
jgi:hypothetical protein